jgi:sugar (pentulose or hexulose) kinase
VSVSLLLDLGASRLKACLYDHDLGATIAQDDVPAPAPVHGPGGEVEVDGASHPAKVRTLCESLIRTSGRVPQQAVLCSEMHGFALARPGETPTYISWRDERAVKSGTLTSLQEELGQDFRRITGMKLRAGLPFVTLAHLARKGALPGQATLLSLPEMIFSALGEISGTIDESMAAGLGLYDIDGRAWSDRLLAFCSSGAPGLLRPVTSGAEPAGILRLGGVDVPVLAAVGDLQAAVYGTQASTSALCINVGTGSQVNRVGFRPADLMVEERPFFEGARMATISHIPAGRAMLVFEGLFASIMGGRGNFWAIAADLSWKEIAETPLRVDLNCFAGAWRYRDGGAISGIAEGNFTARNLVAAVIKALVDQYIEATGIIDPERACDKIVVAGGIPRRLPAFASAIEHRSGRPVMMAPQGEETLLGLIRLAERLLSAKK